MRVLMLLVVFGCQERLESKDSISLDKASPRAQAEKRESPENNSTEKVVAGIATLTNELGVYDPLAGRSRLEVCKANGLSLIQWPFDERQSKHQELCCKEDGYPKGSIECELDWPVSDVLPCADYGKLLDTMRNEIFAYYGRVFLSEQWKAHFSEQPWYKVREDYSVDWLNQVAKDNVAHLMRLKQERRNCFTE